jgi:hypothetical protein
MTGEGRHDGWWKMCSGCRDRLGIYEPVVVRYPDGRIDDTSFLNLPEPLRHQLSACFHRGCLLAEQEEAP